MHRTLRTHIIIFADVEEGGDDIRQSGRDVFLSQVGGWGGARGEEATFNPWEGSAFHLPKGEHSQHHNLVGTTHRERFLPLFFELAVPMTADTYDPRATLLVAEGPARMGSRWPRTNAYRGAYMPSLNVLASQEVENFAV